MNPNIPDWFRHDEVHDHVNRQVANFGKAALHWVASEFGKQVANFGGELTGEGVRDLVHGALKYKERMNEYSKIKNPTTFPEEYEDSAHAAGMLIQETYKPYKERGDRGPWKHLPQFGSDKVSVYERHHTGNWTVIIRGSHLRPSPQMSISDYAENFRHITGSVNTDEQNMITSHIKQLTGVHKDRYPNGQFALAGHSLGGVHTAHALKDPDIRKHVKIAHIFSAVGSLFRDEKKDAFPSYLYNHIGGTDDIIGQGFQPHTGATNVKHSLHAPSMFNSHWYPQWEQRAYWRDHVRATNQPNRDNNTRRHANTRQARSGPPHRHIQASGPRITTDSTRNFHGPQHDLSHFCYGLSERRCRELRRTLSSN